MKDKRILKSLIILLLVVAIFAVALVACTDGDGLGAEQAAPTEAVDKTAVLNTLSQNIDSSYRGIAAAKTANGAVTVASEYSIDAEGLKYTITYNSSRDYSKIEDSEIYLKIYDDETHATRVMTYYKAGVLYYELDGARKKITNFGTSAMFPIFVSLVSVFDLSDVIVNDSFPAQIPILTNLIKASSIKVYNVTETRTSISVSSVNLDSSKSVPNNMIASAFGQFGTTFDALGLQFLGTKLSDLAAMKIRTIDANLVEFYADNGIFDEMQFDFSGRLETLSSFSFKGGFSLLSEKMPIAVSDWDNEDTINATVTAYGEKNGLSATQVADLKKHYQYNDFTLGEGTYTGAMTIVGTGATYDAVLDFNLNSTNNDTNVFSLKLLESGMSVSSAYYLDGRMYLDLGDLYDVFNVGLGLSNLNFPKASLIDFDIAALSSRIFDVMDNLVRETDEAATEEDRQNAWGLVLNKVKSDGTKLTLNVDKELIQALNEMSSNPIEATNVASWIATVLGIDSSITDRFLATKAFDDVSLAVGFDVATKEWELTLLYGEQQLVVLSLEPANAEYELFRAVTGAYVSVVNDTVTLGANTYTFNATRVMQGVTEVGIVDLNAKRFTVNNIAYTFAASELRSNLAGNPVVGLFDKQQQLVSLNGVVYRYDDGGRLLSLDKRGYIDNTEGTVVSITENGVVVEYDVILNALYLKGENINQKGIVSGDIVTVTGGKTYYSDGGVLYENPGSVAFSASVATVTMDYEEATPTTYTAGAGDVYTVRGVYRANDGQIYIDGVTYYAKGDKLYSDLTYALELGSMDYLNKTAALGAAVYSYADVKKAVDQHVYKEIAASERIGMHLMGEVAVTNVESQSMSKLLGAFIGDSLGLNTPMTLAATDRLVFDIKADMASAASAVLYIDMYVRAKNGTIIQLLKLYSATDDSGDVLIDYTYLGVKFRAPRTEVLRALQVFAGEDSVFYAEEPLSGIFEAISMARTTYDQNGIQFALDYVAIAGQEVQDPMLKLFGVPNLSAQGVAKLDYDLDMSEVDAANMDAAYIVPELNDFLAIDIADSIYDAEWIEEIGFKNIAGLTLKIPYEPDTVTIVTGKSVYEPRASLLGQVLTYTLMLNGGGAATKVVSEIVGNEIVFDNYEATPVPSGVNVRFDDGTYGQLPYEIVGFNYDFIRDTGAVSALYDVIIGRGKIGETILSGVSVSVVCRELSTDYAKHYQKTILGTVSIDPYAYAESGDASFLPTSLTMRFLTQSGSSTIRTEDFSFEWDFAFDQIDVGGGTIYATATRIYKNGLDTVYREPTDLVYEVVVSPKLVSYIAFGTETAHSTYTVDVMDSATYTVPVRSREDYRLAVYFTDGQYRIIGNESIGLVTDAYCDGYFDLRLSWQYVAADTFGVNGVSNPLGGGTVSTNTATLSIAGLSDQLLSVEVREPTRRVAAGASYNGIIKNTETDGSIIRSVASFTASTVDAGWGVGEAVTVNPYALEALPMTVEIGVRLTSGSTELTYFSYPVIEWLTDTNIVKHTADGYFIAYPTSTETYFKAVAVIGNGAKTQEVVVPIKNLDAVYEHFHFDGLAMDENVITVNAYSPYQLPTSFTLALADGTEYYYGAEDFKWVINYGTAERTEITPLTAQAYEGYSAFVSGESKTYDSAWIENYYRFANVDGDVTLTAYVATGVDGSLEQALPLVARVVKLQDFLPDFESLPTALDGTVTVDQYSATAGQLVTALKDDDNGGLSVMPLKMYSVVEGHYYHYYQKVDWVSGTQLNALLSALSSASSASTYTLEGVVFRNVLAEQTFSAKFVLRERSVSSAADFYFSSLQTAATDLLTAEYAYDAGTGAKSLNVTLLKPYALQLKSGGAFEYALPSEYFAATLAKMFVSFSDGVSATYDTDIVSVLEGFNTTYGATFDDKVLTFKTGGVTHEYTEVVFPVRMSQGSAEDYITVNLKTMYDYIVLEQGTVSVELYKPDGSLAYTIENGNGSGYPISNVYTATYLRSGVVNYIVDWTLNSTTFVGQVDGDRYIKLSALKNAGGSCELSSRLPDGSSVVRTINVYAKNIGETYYNASKVSVSGAVSDTVTAEQGIITLGNVYELYDLMRVLPDGTRVLDSSKVPNVLNPMRHSGSGTTSGVGYNSDIAVNFTVDWDFSDGAGYAFFVDAANVVHGNVQDGTYRVAFATVGGYGTETQTVTLYVRITDKTVTSVTADGYDFRYDTTTMQQSLFLDPYKANAAGVYEWTVALPTALSVSFADNTSYTFTGGVKYSYVSVAGEISAPSVEMSYDRFVKFGATLAPEDCVSAEFFIILTDGYKLSLTINLIQRIYNHVSVPYIATDDTQKFVDDAYYIDPYTSSTHAVPTAVSVYFDGDTVLQLNVEWSVYADIGGTLTPTELNISYAGAEYVLRTSLVGRVLVDGVWTDSPNAQSIDIRVKVLNRSLKADFSAADAGLSVTATGDSFEIVRTFDDYIAARLSDIFPHVFTEADFVDLAGQSCPIDMLISYPSITYFAANGEVATDNIIANGMAATAFNARLGDSAVGQSGALVLTTARLTIKATSAFDFGGTGSTVLYFNPYSRDSLVTEFGITYSTETWDGSAWVAADDTVLTYYTAFSGASDPTKSRHLIYWGAAMATNQNGPLKFSFGNATKTERGSLENIGTYFYSKVDGVRIDLGFGLQNGTTVPYEYVVDPLSPDLPSKTLRAYGTINGAEYDMGEVSVVWPETALQAISMSGETRLNVPVTLTHNIAGVSNIPVNFTLYYLDRTPKVAWTTDVGYSTLASDGYYKIYDSSIAGFAGITIDPIVGMYVSSAEYTGYRYISNLRVELRTYDRTTDPLMYLAVQKYGAVVDIVDLDYSRWSLNGGVISLAGTGDTPITMALLGGSVMRDGQRYVLSLPETTIAAENPYLFKLNIKNRAISQTGITKPADLHVAFDGTDSETDYSIDPYNITLPKSFSVVFGSGLENESKILSWRNSYAELWTFDDDSLAKLRSKRILDGIALDEMYAIAYFMVNGEAFDVRFPILPRYISVEDEGNRDVAVNGLIPGGTVYVLEGANTADIAAQLPKGLYYNFNYGAAVETYSFVTISEYETISFYKAGSYQLKAKLGITALDYNVLFDIVVISPDLMDVRTTTDAVGTVTSYSAYRLIYDRLPVSVNSSSVMLAGLESEWVPKYLSIGEDHYLRIVSVAYSMSEMKATLKCSYRFIEESDGPRIAGSEDGSRDMVFEYEVPLVANRIDALVADATLESTTMTVQLGESISLSAFPIANFDGRQYHLYWDITGANDGDVVDVNVAGSYTVYGYLLDAFNVTKVYALTLVVEKRNLASTEFGFVAEQEQLNRSFSGQRVDWNVSVPRCLDVYGEWYVPTPSFAYSADNGISWSTNQPVAVGSYLIKMIIDDVNVHAEKVLDLVINKAIIDARNISFSNTTVSYNGRAQAPTVNGVPSGVDYYFTFTRQGVNYESAVNASNGIAYRATLVFVASDSYIYNGSALTVDFAISKADPNYIAAASEVYNGLERHVYVEGLPTVQTNGLTITYIYNYMLNGVPGTTTGMIRDVGTYTYEINIIGGQNYENNTLSGTYVITPAVLTVDVGHIEVTYLGDSKTLDDQLVITGVVGTDSNRLFSEVFGTLSLTSSVSIDGFSKPGSYDVFAGGLYNKNYVVSYIDDATDGDGIGRYNIVLPDGTMDLAAIGLVGETLSDTLVRVVGAAAENSELKLYLPAASYAAFTISTVGLSLTLMGEYDATGAYVSVLDGIDVERGALTLGAIAFSAITDAVSITLRAAAGSLTMDRVGFLSDGSGSVAQNSTGVYAAFGYQSDVTAYKVSVTERFTGFYMGSGTLTIENSIFSGCVAGITAAVSRFTLIDSTFIHSTMYALYLTAEATAVEMNGNILKFNVIAVRYNVALSLASNSEVINENEYYKNTANLVAQQ